MSVTFGKAALNEIRRRWEPEAATTAALLAAALNGVLGCGSSASASPVAATNPASAPSSTTSPTPGGLPRAPVSPPPRRVPFSHDPPSASISPVPPELAAAAAIPAPAAAEEPARPGQAFVEAAIFRAPPSAIADLARLGPAAAWSARETGSEVTPQVSVRVLLEDGSPRTLRTGGTRGDADYTWHFVSHVLPEGRLRLGVELRSVARDLSARTTLVLSDGQTLIMPLLSSPDEADRLLLGVLRAEVIRHENDLQRILARKHRGLDPEGSSERTPSGTPTDAPNQAPVAPPRED